MQCELCKVLKSVVGMRLRLGGVHPSSYIGVRSSAHVALLHVAPGRPSATRKEEVRRRMRGGGGAVVAGTVATALSPALVLRRSFCTPMSSSSSLLAPLFRPLISPSPPRNLSLSLCSIGLLSTLPHSHFSMARFHGLLTPPHAALRFPGIASISIRKLCSPRATPVSGSGSIDSPMMQSMETKIKEQLEADVVMVKDAYGDGRHVSISVISKTFEGKSAVNRQRMVYQAIWEELQSTVHAVDEMITKTPAEAAEEK